MEQRITLKDYAMRFGQTKTAKDLGVYPTITIRGQLSDNMVYTEKHIRIISVTTAAAIHPVIGSSENDVQLRTRHPETTAD